MANDNTISCVIFGDMGCFTDPAAKVERVTYPIITPRAAQSILGNIHGKPEFNYRVNEIHLLSYPSYYIDQRKENSNKTGYSPTLRKTKYLLNPRYRVIAEIIPTEKGIKECSEKDSYNHLVKKHSEQFYRNLNKGNYYRNLSIGLSHLHAEAVADTNEESVKYSDSFRMFYDWRYIGNKIAPTFFDANIIDGKMIVPSKLFNNKIFNYNK